MQSPAQSPAKTPSTEQRAPRTPQAPREHRVPQAPREHRVPQAPREHRVPQAPRNNAHRAHIIIREPQSPQVTPEPHVPQRVVKAVPVPSQAPQVSQRSKKNYPVPITYKTKAVPILCEKLTPEKTVKEIKPREKVPVVEHLQEKITIPSGETTCRFVGSFKGTFTDSTGKVVENFETKLSTNHKFTLGDGDVFNYTNAARRLIPSTLMNTTSYDGEFTYTTKGVFDKPGAGKQLSGTLTGVFTGTLSGILTPCNLDPKLASCLPKIKA